MAQFLDIIIAVQRDSIALQTALFYLLGGVTPPHPPVFSPLTVGEKKKGTELERALAKMFSFVAYESLHDLQSLTKNNVLSKLILPYNISRTPLFEHTNTVGMLSALAKNT